MGLTVYVYKNMDLKGDCSNNGLSNQYTKFCVTNVEGPFEPSKDAPPVLLLEGNLEGTVKIVPEELDGLQCMAGGCFASTCDSRFSMAIEAITGNRFYGAVAVHDRVE